MAYTGKIYWSGLSYQSIKVNNDSPERNYFQIFSPSLNPQPKVARWRLRAPSPLTEPQWFLCCNYVHKYGLPTWWGPVTAHPSHKIRPAYIGKTEVNSKISFRRWTRSRRKRLRHRTWEPQRFLPLCLCPKSKFEMLNRRKGFADVERSRTVIETII